jgi:hypothetical protein
MWRALPDEPADPKRLVIEELRRAHAIHISPAPFTPMA